VDPVEVMPGLEIFPRDAWADKPPTGPLENEALDDVRFLLVHHTASSNSYSPEAVAGTLRGFFDFHTGPEKVWPDIAYNFLVDRFGRVWEAREGSIGSPVKGSATGGSQGFALLCSFVGDHMAEPPTTKATNAMGILLGWLASKYEVDISEGATTNFVSRGSNRWPSGSEVTARAVSGHREMSQTTCPGDFGFASIDSEIAPKAREVLAELQPTARTEASTTTTTEARTTTAETATTTAPSSTAPGQTAQDVVVVVENKEIPTSWLLPAAAVAALAGAIGIRRRRI
jgi:hypothetical protein